MHSPASMLSVAIVLAAIAVYLLLYIEPSPATVFSSLPDFGSVDVRVEDGQAALQRFSRGLQFRTISNSNNTNHVEDQNTFRKLHVYLEEAFPLVHEQLRVEQASDPAGSKPRTGSLSNVTECHRTFKSSGIDNRWEPVCITQVNEWSLLYEWRGTDDTLKPVLCISHMDVVPVTSLAAWTEPPFSGVIKDG